MRFYNYSDDHDENDCKQALCPPYPNPWRIWEICATSLCGFNSILINRQGSAIVVIRPGRQELYPGSASASASASATGDPRTAGSRRRQAANAKPHQFTICFCIFEPFISLLLPLPTLTLLSQELKWGFRRLSSLFYTPAAFKTVDLGRSTSPSLGDICSSEELGTLCIALLSWFYQ